MKQKSQFFKMSATIKLSAYLSHRLSVLNKNISISEGVEKLNQEDKKELSQKEIEQRKQNVELYKKNVSERKILSGFLQKLVHENMPDKKWTKDEKRFIYEEYEHVVEHIQSMENPECAWTSPKNLKDAKDLLDVLNDVLNTVNKNKK